MMTLIETMARAIDSEAFDSWRVYDYRDRREQALVAARAALEAARFWGEHLERTTGWDSSVNFNGPLDAYNFAYLWEAAIDRALGASE